MKYSPLIIFLTPLVNIGCKQPNNPKAFDSWSSLTIISDQSTVMKIDNYDDTSTVKYYDGGGFFTGYHKVKVDSLKLHFTMAEKDTLYLLVKDIISDPVKSKIVCTDFVGDLKLIIDYNGEFKKPGSYRQSIEYSGICNWDTLSDKTIQLHKILKRKIRWWSK